MLTDKLYGYAPALLCGKVPSHLHKRLYVTCSLIAFIVTDKELTAPDHTVITIACAVKADTYHTLAVADGILRHAGKYMCIVMLNLNKRYTVLTCVFLGKSDCVIKRVLVAYNRLRLTFEHFCHSVKRFSESLYSTYICHVAYIG